MSLPPYKQALDASLRQIRLLAILPEPHPLDSRLQCHLTIKSLLQEPDDRPYQALSYKWGQPDNFDFKIWVNDVLVHVRQNLLCALRVLRADEESMRLPIWIDALCIDQMNMKERGHQVAMMGIIYRGAQRVISWLGTPDRQELENRTLDVEESSPRQLPVAAFEFMNTVASSIVSNSVRGRSAALNWAQKSFLAPLTREALRRFTTIFTNEYWERLWIIQEVCLAHKLVLIFGRETMEWDLFHRCRTAFSDLANSTSEASLILLEDGSRDMSPEFSLQISQDLAEITKSRPWKLDDFMRSDAHLIIENLKAADTNLESVLELSGNSLCEDKRDKIYGILGLNTDVDEYEIPVDYSLSLFQVYINVIRDRLRNFHTDKEVSSFYEYPDDDLRSFVLARDIINLSSRLQRSLLGPDFDMSSFEDMRSGRVAMLAEPKADLTSFVVKGKNLGKITVCSTTLHGLTGFMPRNLDWATPFLSILEEKIGRSLTTANSGVGKVWENFCFDLSIGCEQIGEGASWQRQAPHLTLFVTDLGSIGLAPDIIMPGDLLWDYIPPSRHVAIVRGEKRNYMIVSRACHIQDWIGLEYYSLVKSGKDDMNVSLNLAELQILTSPLRGTQDAGH